MEIKIEHLEKAYGEKRVLENFNAVFQAGRTTCLMGPSGKGKTTLLRILMGLENADQGRICGLKGKRISAVFQEDRLCENLSAGANVRLVQEKRKGKTKEFSERLESGLGRMGLEGCKNQPVREMSGGMKRRIALLRALYAAWDVLFLDEPFKGLDLETKEKVMGFVKEICQGRTVILVTHEPEEAKALGAEILEM